MSVNDETTDDDLSPDLDTVSYSNNSDNTWTHSDGEFSGLVMSRGNLIMDTLNLTESETFSCLLLISLIVSELSCFQCLDFFSMFVVITKLLQMLFIAFRSIFLVYYRRTTEARAPLSH